MTSAVRKARKAPPPPAKPQRIKVEWVDSQSSTIRLGVWAEAVRIRDAYRRDGLDLIKSRGFLLDLTSAYLLMAGDIQLDADTEGVTYVGHVTAIPRGCIRKIKRFKGGGERIDP